MRYYAFRIPDLAPLHGDVNLRGVSLYSALSEPGELRCTLDKAQAYLELTVEGESETTRLMRDYGTLLVSVDGNRARAFIVDLATQDAGHQDRLAVSAVGFGNIPRDQPWMAQAYNGVEVDPMSIVRRIWSYLTSQPDSMTVTVDGTTSPVRIGEEEQHNEGFVRSDGSEAAAFDYGPYRLNWWNTDDLQKEIEDLSVDTPFEWRERTTLDRDSEDPPQLHIELGYPRLESVRRERLKFTVGVNVRNPVFEDDEDYFSHVLVVGNGEGSASKRGEAARRTTKRMRRVKVIEDNSLMSHSVCNRIAQEEVDRADREGAFIESCTVIEHKAAPLHAFDIGDTIRITGSFTWGRHVQDCRIRSIDHAVAAGTAVITVERI